MSHETLADEATRFFGALKTKRTKTIQTKMADFVQKEDQLRKCIFFKICKESGGEGVREHMGREDVFRRKKYTIPKLNAFLSILVPRVTSQNFKIGPLWDFEKRPF